METGAEYPDDIYRIVFSLGTEDPLLDSSYIIKLAQDSFIYTISPEKLYYNGFSGSDFITTIDFILSAIDYQAQVNDPNFDLIKLLMEYGVERPMTIDYSLYLSQQKELTKTEIDNEIKYIKAKRDADYNKYSKEIQFYTNVYDSVTKLNITPITINKRDSVYQYLNTVSDFTIKDIKLNQSLVFVSDILYDEDTEKTIFNAKIYDRAKNRNQLLSLVDGYRKDFGFWLNLYHEGQYIIGKYDPNSHKLTIPDTPTQIFTKVIPQGFIDEYEGNINVTWTLYGIQIDFNLFLHAIMIDNILGSFFTVNENINPTFMRLKSSVNFVYRISPNEETIFEVTIQSQQLYSDQKVEIMDFVNSAKEEISKLQEKVMRVGTPYITFSINGVNNPKQADGIKHLISYLVYYYAEKLQNDLIDEYKIVFKNWKPKYNIIRLRGVQGGNLISKLQSIDKDKFPEGYARRCSNDRQVDIISQEELKTLKETGKIVSYVEFPKAKNRSDSEHVVIVYCPTSKFPYIGFKQNIDLPNASKYPWIPCCYNKSQDKDGTGYRKYMNNEAEIDNVDEITLAIKDKGNLAKIDKLLDYGRKADMPNILLRLFRNYGLSEMSQINGVYKSINSLIHCVMFAIGYNDKEIFSKKSKGYKDAKQYTLIKSLREREQYIINWRSKISENELYRIALKQELYDHTDEEIRLMLTDVFEHFDSTIFIRVLEIHFKVSIYVFDLEFGINQYPTLEIPRHRYIHVKNFSNNPVILIFKHYSASGKVGYELISSYGDNKFTINPFVITDDIKKNQMFQLYKDMYSITTFIKNDFYPNKQGKKTQTITGYDNIFTFNIYNKLLENGLLPTAQYLDHYGKCRGYEVEISIENNKQVKGSILCFPQQPVALPVITTITPWSFGLISNIFSGNIITRTDVEDGTQKLRGIWLSIDNFEQGLYLPIVPIQNDKLISSTKRAANPLVPHITRGDFTDFSIAETAIKKFLSVVTWLYRLYANEMSLRRQRQSNVQYYMEEKQLRIEYLKKFADYFKVSNNDNEYIFDNIEIYLLKNTNFNDGLDQISYLSNETVVYKGYIQFNSEKLLKDVTYYLENFLIKQSPDFYTKSNREPNTKLEYSDERLFRSFEEFESWIITLTKPPTIIVDSEEITPFRTEPLIYRSGVAADSSMFIIQNVKDGDINRALNVCIQWKNGRNLGYDAPGFTQNKPINYKILELLGRELTIRENINNNEKDDDFFVLKLHSQYETEIPEYYAAVLKLNI